MITGNDVHRGQIRSQKVDDILGVDRGKRATSKLEHLVDFMLLQQFIIADQSERTDQTRVPHHRLGAVDRVEQIEQLGASIVTNL